LGGEVELLQCLGGREPGEPHPADEAALLGRLHLDVEEVVEELRVPRLVVLRLLERGGEMLGDRALPEAARLRGQDPGGGIVDLDQYARIAKLAGQR